MPNTLVHLGAQGVLSRVFFRSPDFKWIFLGLLIPDLPWILQRVFRLLPACPDRYALALYSLVQSSLFFGLLLAAAIALLDERPWRTWRLLGFNVLLHLLLDASEYKGGNGVHLLAPFGWKLLDFGFVEPEGRWMLALTLFGLVYSLMAFPAGARRPPPPLPRRLGRWAGAGALLGLYLLLPFALRKGPETENAFSIATLRNAEARTGRAAAFDRAVYLPGDDGGRLRLFSGEEVRAEGLGLTARRLVSAEGVFLAPDRFQVETFVVHTPHYRDAATGLGLAIGAAMWLYAFLKHRGRAPQAES